MRKHFHKLLAAVITFMTVVGFYMPAKAALMGEAQVELSNPKPATSSKYIFSANLGSTHNVKAIKMTWLTAATGGATPNGLSTNSPDIYEVSANLGEDTDWTSDFTHMGDGYATMVNNAQGSLNSGVTISWTLDGIVNPNLTQRGSGTPGCTSTNNAGTGNGNLSTGTCFILIQTYNNVNMTANDLKDNVTITYAVTTDVTMSAKVDPALTFVVSAVADNTAVADANGTSSTTNASTYNTLDFETLTPNAIRLLAHSLTVRTNANNGYLVYGHMTTPLTGTSVNTNNIDPYTGNPGDGAASETAPNEWTSPTSTTKNVNSGYLGYNTTERDITGVTWDSDLWAPLDDGDPTATTPHYFMESAGQDDGLTATVISYALEVDVYQPSDSYQGVLQYSVVPKY